MGDKPNAMISRTSHAPRYKLKLPPNFLGFFFFKSPWDLGGQPIILCAITIISFPRRPSNKQITTDKDEEVSASLSLGFGNLCTSQ